MSELGYCEECGCSDLCYGCVEKLRKSTETSDYRRDLLKQLEENEILRRLIRDAVERLQMPIKEIRGDGFSELMGRLRRV